MRWVALTASLAACLALSWHFARQGIFVCFGGDLEQIFWQGSNLATMLSTGNPNLTTSFMGVPTPYTYTPSLHWFSMLLRTLSWLSTPYLAYNLLWTAITLANFWSMYAFLRLGLPRSTSIVGAAIYGLSPAILKRSLAHLYLAQSFCLPLLFGLMYRDRVTGHRLSH